MRARVRNCCGLGRVVHQLHCRLKGLDVGTVGSSQPRVTKIMTQEEVTLPVVFAGAQIRRSRAGPLVQAHQFSGPSCDLTRAAEVGLREMRQNASELVRRAEAGERLTVTVAGRPAAVLGPIASRGWRQWDEISDLFRTPVDAGLVQDLDRLDNHLRDPWAMP